jgi:hypothetical protein
MLSAESRKPNPFDLANSNYANPMKTVREDFSQLPRGCRGEIPFWR